MAFYRKYRPQVIEEIDNLAVRKSLLALLAKDRKDLPHAYLFSGPRGAGKTTSARLIAKLFNCEKPTKSGPCGTCEQCTTIAEGRHMDVIEIDAASNRGIDEMRALRESIGLAPVSGTTKVYIIDEVHMLTTEAFNALLKTLEEPPAHAVFILATTDPQKVPATVKSRCMLIAFSRATNDELVSALARIAKVEKLQIDTDALVAVAACADGAFRDAVKLLEQVSFHQGKVTVEVVMDLLAQGDQGTRDGFLRALAKGDVHEALALVSTLVLDGKDIKQFLIENLTELERILVATAKGEKNDVWTQEKLQHVIRKLTQAYGELRLSPIPQLPLELAIVELCSRGEVTSDPRSINSGLARPADAKAVAGKQETEKEKPSEKLPAVSSKPLVSTGLITSEKLIEHWRDVIEAVKGENTSLAGVLRSTRPKGVAGGIVTIEAFYSFHKDKLSEPKSKELVGATLKKLFGENVKVEIVLGKK